VPTVGDVTAALDDCYDPRLAEAWDSVGLTCGDPQAGVGRVLLAIDPVGVTVEEALKVGADLLVTHHPLLLRPVHTVGTTTYKGRLLDRLITGNVALYTAHTNADVAVPGVSDALAAALGVHGTRPLEQRNDDTRDKLVTFVPDSAVDAVLDALTAAGAGTIGNYRRCAWLTSGTGTFLPAAGATPVIGELGRVEHVPETRVEMVLPRARRAAVVDALLSAHPYEEPAYDVYELASRPTGRGFGRVGELPEPVRLTEFAGHAAAALPGARDRIRVAGDPKRAVRTVAVAGGAGDAFLAAAARAGADVYVTADLRHHPASEHLESGGPALLDVPHWSTEQPWLPNVAAQLAGLFGDSVEVVVSEIVTDPWNVPSRM
jgi:dinuclear metal center YbgI/SA1388 family protein